SDRLVPDYRAGLGQPVRGLRIGVPYHWFEDEAPVSPQVSKAFSASVETFEKLGVTVRAVCLPKLAAFEDVKKIIAMADLYAMHRNTLRTAPELFGANFRGRI